MAVSNFTRTNDNGRLTVKDGTATPVSHVCAFDKGDSSLTGVSKKLNNTAKIQRRGKLVGVVFTDRKFPQFSFSAFVTDLSASPGTLLEMLLASDTCSANVSTMGTGANVVYCVDLVLDYQDATGAFTEQVVLNDCEVLNVDFVESADGNTITVTFEVLGAITGSGFDASEIS